MLVGGGEIGQAQTDALKTMRLLLSPACSTWGGALHEQCHAARRDGATAGAHPVPALQETYTLAG